MRRPAGIQRVAATEQLSAALAHEINQPLGAILRNVEAAGLLLQNESPDIDEVRDIITDIINTTAELLRTVIDRGLGVFPAELPNLFEPFYTTKATALGIGLAISRTIIELHDGRLWGENNPEGGAIFLFTLRPNELGGES